MKKAILTACLIFTMVVLEASPLSLNACFGRWQNGVYVFSFNPNYTASVIIFVNPRESFVFNGVFNVEKDNLVRININEMKSCQRASAFSKSGFSRAASSHFIFALDPKADKHTLVAKPKEIIIDGNNSEGYFDQEIVLKK